MRESVSVKDFGADSTGATDCAQAFANAVAALPSTGGTLYIPDGNYTYSGGLIFTNPATLVMGEAAFMNYTGSGYAVQLGALGKTAIDLSFYKVEGGVFTNGSACNSCIYIPAWVAYPTIMNVRFNNFGNVNGTGYAINAQFQNWLIKVSGCTHTMGDKRGNFCNAQGVDPVSGAADFGSSQLFATNNNCISGNHGGVGFATQGAGSVIHSNKIEGRTPNVIVGSYANSSKVINNYFESLHPDNPGGGDGSCIQFGDGSWRPVGGLVVENNYCNLHQSDYGNPGSFVAPINTQTPLLYSSISNNSFGASIPTIPIVKLNNLVNQNGNIGVGNNSIDVDPPILHSAGSNIQGWRGEEPHIINLGVGVGTETSGDFKRTAMARLTIDGVVKFAGYIFATSTTVTAGTGIGTVPPGYVPARNVTTIVVDQLTQAVSTITIDIYGVIKLGSNLTSSSVLFLETVSYSIL